jgi:predicted enzyme related to lactoylglutathione lyase
VVFDTKPIPFAGRTPVVDLDAVDMPGHGIAIWFGCDDADALRDHLASRDVPIAFSPKDGLFGRYFAFQDPFGYTITAHTVQEMA